ncbi:MAG: peptide-methionine (R)-S-oxide reductase, partial [Gemmatimonadales bacterium]
MNRSMKIAAKAAAVLLAVACMASPPVPAQGNPARPGTLKSFVKPNDAALKSMLSPIQYAVTQHDATEQPYRNEFWDNHDAGIYVDVV